MKIKMEKIKKNLKVTPIPKNRLKQQNIRQKFDPTTVFQDVYNVKVPITALCDETSSLEEGSWLTEDEQDRISSELEDDVFLTSIPLRTDKRLPPQKKKKLKNLKVMKEKGKEDKLCPRKVMENKDIDKNPRSKKKKLKKQKPIKEKNNDDLTTPEKTRDKETKEADTWSVEPICWCEDLDESREGSEEEFKHVMNSTKIESAMPGSDVRNFLLNVSAIHPDEKSGKPACLSDFNFNSEYSLTLLEKSSPHNITYLKDEEMMPEPVLPQMGETKNKLPSIVRTIDEAVDLENLSSIKQNLQEEKSSSSKSFIIRRRPSRKETGKFIGTPKSIRTKAIKGRKLFNGENSDKKSAKPKRQNEKKKPVMQSSSLEVKFYKVDEKKLEDYKEYLKTLPICNLAVIKAKKKNNPKKSNLSGKRSLQ